MRAALLLISLALASACTDRASATQMRGVVSLHEVTTEIVVALGATEQLVGVAEPIDVPAGVARDIARVPRVAGLESILARRPHTVLGLDVVEERDPELVARLRDRGIDVYLADPVTLEDVGAMTRAIASRLDRVAAGERIVLDLRSRVERTTGRVEQPVRVFVYDCCDPPFTAGGRTVLSDVIAQAGGQNVFGDLATDWATVSWEAAVARAPTLVVIHDYELAGQGNVDDKRRALAAIPSLASVPTIVLPLGLSLGGLRSVDALERLRSAIGAQRALTVGVQPASTRGEVTR